MFSPDTEVAFVKLPLSAGAVAPFPVTALIVPPETTTSLSVDAVSGTNTAKLPV